MCAYGGQFAANESSLKNSASGTATRAARRSCGPTALRRGGWDVQLSIEAQQAPAALRRRAPASASKRRGEMRFLASRVAPVDAPSASRCGLAQAPQVVQLLFDDGDGGGEHTAAFSRLSGTRQSRLEALHAHECAPSDDRITRVMHWITTVI